MKLRTKRPGWKSLVPLQLSRKSTMRFFLFPKVQASGQSPNDTPVYLNVYDLTPMNGYIYWAGLGIFHSGIEGTYLCQMHLFKQTYYLCTGSFCSSFLISVRFRVINPARLHWCYISHHFSWIVQIIPTSSSQLMLTVNKLQLTFMYHSPIKLLLTRLCIKITSNPLTWTTHVCIVEF